MPNAEDWEDLAELDPLWAVLSDPARKGGRWELDEFFARGEQDVEDVLRRVEALGGVERRGALDFGCGVGRLSRALASRFERVSGVDVAPRMIELAGELNAAFENATFTRSIEDVPEVDLVLSLLVLQHLPRSELEPTLARLLARLRPGGLLVFQLPSHMRPFNRLQLSRRIYRAARLLGVSPAFLHARTPLTPMQMNALPPDRVVELLGRLGLTDVSVQPYGLQTDPTQSSLYLARVKS